MQTKPPTLTDKAADYDADKPADNELPERPVSRLSVAQWLAIWVAKACRQKPA
jgi:hypothetical protein